MRGRGAGGTSRSRRSRSAAAGGARLDTQKQESRGPQHGGGAHSTQRNTFHNTAKSTTHLTTSVRFAIQFLIFPMVPITTWLAMGGMRPTPALAVSVHWMPVYLAILDSTATFCSTSSRVGQMQSAWGFWIDGSTRESIPRTKHVVLPLPFFACGVGKRRVGTRRQQRLSVGRVSTSLSAAQRRENCWRPAEQRLTPQPVSHT